MLSESDAPSVESLIRRVQNTNDTTAPWEGISFTKPVGSDNLADELKQAYPECSDLRQRKHMAAIAFLQHELTQMRSNNHMNKVVESECPITPEESSLSNDGLDSNSRQSSVSASRPSSQKTQAWSSAAAGSIQIQSPTSSFVNSSQQIVFSVSDGHTLQPTTRRTMTKEERLAYRKTRKRGACSTCRQQKGKCTHVGGTLARSRVSEETINFQKRHSIDVRIAHEMPEQGPASPHPLQNNENLGSPQYQHEITNALSIATELHGLRQPARVPVDSQWTHQDAQSDAARYVHNGNVNTRGGSIACQSGSPWQVYSISATTHPHFIPGYGHNVTMDIPENPLSASAIVQPSPMDVTCPSPFTEFVHDPWNVSQEPNREDLEPD